MESIKEEMVSNIDVNFNFLAEKPMFLLELKISISNQKFNFFKLIFISQGNTICS